MRQVLAHEAELFMAPDGDIQAPGAAVTVGLCGHWDHEPACPLAPHHTEANRLFGGVVHLRTVFAAEEDSEDAVRQHIDDALTGGELLGPGGATQWQLSDSRPSAVSGAERDLGARLIRT